MQSNDKKRICIVVRSLDFGGAEQSSANLSKLFFSLGYEVHIVSVLNNIEYNYKGELLNLGLLKEKDNSIFGRINRFFIFKKYIKEKEFNYLLDSRPRPGFFKEFLINKLLYKKQKVIYIVRSFNLNTYFPKNKIQARILYKNAFKILCVSKEIEKEIETKFSLKNTRTIYDVLDLKSNLERAKETIDVDYNYILFFGRLDDDVKNISLLIEAYNLSILAKQYIKLVILGNGKDLEKLKQKTKSLKLSKSIMFIGFTSNPYKYIKHAKFSVLTSRYEGFPRSLIESLSVGIPVVSVNCKSGPAEIINHEQNGLLVDNYSKEDLSNAFNRFIEDEQLYNTCKNNAKKSIEHLSENTISKNWKLVLK